MNEIEMPTQSPGQPVSFSSKQVGWDVEDSGVYMYTYSKCVGDALWRITAPTSMRPLCVFTSSIRGVCAARAIA